MSPFGAYKAGRFKRCLGRLVHRVIGSTYRRIIQTVIIALLSGFKRFICFNDIHA